MKENACIEGKPRNRVVISLGNPDIPKEYWKEIANLVEGRHYQHHYPLRKARDNRSWESIRRVLQTHCYTTKLLPTVQGELHRIRKAGVPDERQSAIYRQLHVDLTHLPVKRSVSPIRSTKS